MIESHRSAVARRAFGREEGIATEYVVIMILVALGAVLILANYGRNVGNQVDAAGDKIGTLGGQTAGGSEGSGGGAASGGGRAASSASRGDGRSGEGEGSGARAPHAGFSGRRDGRGQPLPETAAEAARTPQDTSASRRFAIGGIIFAAVGLLVAVRFSQSMRRMGEERQRKAEQALREEANRDVEEDTLNVKRSDLFGEDEEGGEER